MGLQQHHDHWDKPSQGAIGEQVQVNETSLDDETSEKHGTDEDRRDMYRMGKVQETRRNFNIFTIIAFSLISLGTWEAQLSVASVGLLNGGTGGIIWLYFVCMVGFGFVIASMAEMASMCPTAGGQYHWVSEFAPRSAQRFLSYLVGWLCVLGWQIGCAAMAFFAGTQIQGLLVLNYPTSYVYKAWHGTLLVFAIAAFAIVFNTLLARHLPHVQTAIVTLHVMGFFAIVITLWTTAERGDAKQIFTSFEDNAGWGSVGLSTLVSLVMGVNTFTGSDSAAHMAEEVRNAAYVLPRSMMWGYLGNGLFGWIMAITFCFCIGSDVQGVLETPTGYPFIQVFYNATGSTAGTTAMTSIMIVIAAFSSVCVVAASSRQLFAFARDKGVPFSAFFSKIPPNWEVPLNALSVTMVISMLLALINIGSTYALNQILSLGIGSMLTSYILSVGCVLLRRMRGQPLLPSKFDLGRLGLPINLFAVAFLVLGYTFIFFPAVPHPAPADMNWACLVYGSVVLLSVVYYLLRGRHRYVGPVEYVRKSA